MCDPLSITLGLGAVVSAGGSLFSGFSQQAAYNDQAVFAERSAVREGQVGNYEAQRMREATDRQVGDIRQSAISGGFALEGSVDTVIADSVETAALDEQAILYDARNRAADKRFEAKLAKSNASSAMIGGIFGGISSAIGGVSGAMQNRQNITRLSNPYAVA